MFTGVYDGGTPVFNNGGNLNLGVNADYDFARVDGPDVPPEGLMVEPLELGQVTIEAVDETDADDDGDNTQAANVDANGADSGNDTQAANNDAIGADNQSAPNNIAANLGPNTLAASATPAAANNTPVQTPASNNNNANSVQSPPAATSPPGPQPRAFPVPATTAANSTAAIEATTNNAAAIDSTEINPNQFGNGLVSCSGNVAVCQDAKDTQPEPPAPQPEPRTTT